MRDMEAKTVAKTLVEEFISRMGVLMIIPADVFCASDKDD